MGQLVLDRPTASARLGHLLFTKRGDRLLQCIPLLLGFVDNLLHAWRRTIGHFRQCNYPPVSSAQRTVKGRPAWETGLILCLCVGWRAKAFWNDFSDLRSLRRLLGSYSRQFVRRLQPGSMPTPPPRNGSCAGSGRSACHERASWASRTRPALKCLDSMPCFQVPPSISDISCLCSA